MCGIVAYLGQREAYPIIIKGLRRLEYRGYDSAGVALLNGDMRIFKVAGKVDDLEEVTAGQNLGGTIGIGHTRWATHGAPNTINAHPHISHNKKLAIIHNGIIENYASLKTELLKRGHVFESDTDTEVLIHLIEDIEQKEGVSLEEAARIALTQVIGAYAIVIASEDNPNKLIAARKSSPMVIGIGDGEFFIASDATPLIEYTRDVVYLNDEEIAIVERGKKLQLKNLQNEESIPYIQELQMQLDMIEKGGYDHYMLKEIYEQPNSIKDSMRGRLGIGNRIQLGGIVEYENKIMQAKRIIVIACGTSWHAGLVAEYLF